MWFNSKPLDFLDTLMFRLGKRDAFLRRDLVRSLAILGASGSGKTSGSGYQLAKAIANDPMASLLILASKPEDKEFWQRIFAHRKNDLLLFGPKYPLRLNGIDFIQQTGGETRDITQMIMTVGETMEPIHAGRSHEPFWRQMNERIIYNAVEAVKGGLGNVSAPDLQRFINGAAQSPAELATPEWKNGFHNQCLQRAFNSARTPIQKHDIVLATEFWLKEYPAMADKTRSSGLAGVMNTLHVFNTGIVRELFSTTTNVSPATLEKGYSLLVDMPISRDGAAGAFALGTWKYLTQYYILKRKATEKTPICVIWADEYQKVANSGPGGDAAFLAESRSHRGAMVVLTQSIHALYSRIHQGGEHETDSLLTNFYHKIFHALGDAKSAEYASSLVGKRLTTHIGGSVAPVDNVYDALFGQSQFSGSFSQHIENILEPRVFMQGLRTGGEKNGCVVDGIVTRSGEPFSTGEAYLKVSFSQRG